MLSIEQLSEFEKIFEKNNDEMNTKLDFNRYLGIQLTSNNRCEKYKITE
ncbi:hypothetical protein SAMN05444278_1233 [Psychroflexus salarius]|uniref:Uncharacterized protein n=1 Tax=Psychroflexus salarius TaxID=1155689 RepID=A0A1M4YDC5_9FLAO|nr:hypothetical protein SAMN05444278_1233 [Psychroflexus salarius]